MRDGRGLLRRVRGCLRLQAITTIEASNRHLADLPARGQHSPSYIAPVEEANVSTPFTGLRDILRNERERIVGRHNCVFYDGRSWCLLPSGDH